ncbi:hypothetical protein Angca_006480, partial [Angiostrongylus cantonensis]
TCSNTLPCLHGGYTDPKNCAVCRCPTGFAGVVCDQAAPNPGACGVGGRNATSSLQSISVRGAVSCSFVIKAPTNFRVYYEVPTFRFSSASLCSFNYLEIKYTADLQRMGARFCRSRPKNSVSESDILVVLYRGSSNTAFTLNYRYDPPTPEVLTTTSSTATTTTTSTSNRTKPSTQATISDDTKDAVSISVPTTTMTTSTTTVTTSICSHWTKCSASCGGCGTRRRICGGKVEEKYCNTKPCRGNFCCRPFLYVNQGFCFRP